MADPRVAHCIFCDDIRFERGNKISFMGLYAGDALVSGVRPPVTLRIAIVAWLISDIEDTPESFMLRVTGPGADELLFAGSFPFPPVPQGVDSKKSHLRAHVQLEGVSVNGNGLIAVYVETEREVIRAGRLAIRFVDEPPAEPPMPSMRRSGDLRPDGVKKQRPSRSSAGRAPRRPR